jgi:hypothetical protein
VKYEKQLVFIDDSGDPGFKIGEGSSSHLIMGCVIFDNPLIAEKTALAIKKSKTRTLFERCHRA